MAVVDVCIVATARTALAIEPWADANLPVHDGLELWLDASHATGDKAAGRTTARLASGATPPGKGRHLRQSDEERPARRSSKSAPPASSASTASTTILRPIGQNAELESFTLVLVAAPRQNIGAFRAFLALNAAERARLQERPHGRPRSVAERQFSTRSTSKAAASAARKTCARSESPFGRCTRWSSRPTPAQKIGPPDRRRPAEAQRPRDGAADQPGRDHGRCPVLQQRRRPAAGRRLRPLRHRRSPALQPRARRRRDRERPQATSTPSTAPSRIRCRRMPTATPSPAETGRESAAGADVRARLHGPRAAGRPAPTSTT